MLKIILIAIVVVIAAVLGFAATRPDAFRIQRSIVIKAAPEKIFALINNFKSWGVWSPWENIDPALKRSFSGPEAGKGAVYAWEGDKNVGSGRMEILESMPSSKILIKLDFFKPFEAHNTAEFTLMPKDGATEVTWAMFGPNPYLGKLIQLFFSMERMVGGQFEKGLADMKAAAEKQ